jgi:hypothetical protein
VRSAAILLTPAASWRAGIYSTRSNTPRAKSPLPLIHAASPLGLHPTMGLTSAYLSYLSYPAARAQRRPQ